MTTASTSRPNSSATLTREEEMELFRSIETAELRISEIERSAEADRADLLHWCKVAKAAKDRVITAHQGWVAHVARSYQAKGLEPEDLQQEGNRGLMRAMGKFDHRRGVRFTTYACQWIRQAICRALSNHSRTIRIPEHQLAAIRSLARVQMQLGQELGIEPTPEEIAAAIGLPVGRVRELLNLVPSTVSLEAMAEDLDGASYHEFLGDASATDPADQCDVSYRTKLLHEALETLTERDREVLALRYGHKGGQEHTLEEIARQFGLSRERIRQIENAAKEKLRRFASAKELSNLVKRLKSSGATEKSKSNSSLMLVPPTAKTAGSRLRMRSVEKNPNHHLWNNNGVWYSNFILETDTGQRHRVRNPLYTKNVEDARERRDKIILLYNGLSVPLAA